MYNLKRPGGVKRTADQDRSMWAAVAMQQHMTRTLMEEGRLSVGVPKPTVQREGTLSLAQKMGLVAPPPPPPAESEWTMATAMSKYRRDVLKPCPICYENFSSAPGEEHEQTILSCSHVFHVKCISQFEKFAREAGHKKQCPVCRRAGYHRRPNIGGKAQVQTFAIVKIQALFRGALARRRYLALRLKKQPAFRADFYYAKLRRYADAMLMTSEAHSRDIDDVLQEIELRRTVAAAMMMTPQDWVQLKHKALGRAAESRALREGSEWDSAIPCHDLECPICLAAVVHRPTAKGTDDDDAEKRRVVVTLTRAPAEAAPVSAPVKKPSWSSSGRVPTKASQSKALAPPVKNKAPLAPMRVILPPRSAEDVHKAQQRVVAATGREAVLTSCGHAFHAQCLSSFEAFTKPAFAHVDPTSIPPARCPVCRSAYLSSALDTL